MAMQMQSKPKVHFKQPSKVTPLTPPSMVSMVTQGKSIFIQIAAYRDPELVPTIRDCLSKAAFPENLVFSIAWQHSADDAWDNLDAFTDDPRFKIIDINYKDARGACWARNKLQQQYAGEDYTLQLDSHHRFIDGWDQELIAMHERLKSNGHKKPLITTYAPSYNPGNDPAERTLQPWKMNFDRFIPEGAVFFLPGGMDDAAATEPVPARFYSAHFAFAAGSFVTEVPHDPDMYFHGEEISITVRAYTWGYDLFHPHKLIVWHEYTRSNRVKQWDDDAAWHEKNTRSHLRNRTLFEMDGLTKPADFGMMYDFGPERTLAEYERYAGISFKRRRAQKYTLEHGVPPNPAPNPDDPSEGYPAEEAAEFTHCIELAGGDVTQLGRCSFCAVIYEDANGTSLHRRDYTASELNQGAHATVRFDSKFKPSGKPYKWIVWPHSKNDGWMTKIESVL